MFLKRLTLACEATFWVCLMAAVGVPQLPRPLVLTVRPAQEQTAPPPAAAASEVDRATAAQPPETLLEHLVARYEHYRDVRNP
jgi:hypothetical protein